MSSTMADISYSSDVTAVYNNLASPNLDMTWERKDDILYMHAPGTKSAHLTSELRTHENASFLSYYENRGPPLLQLLQCLRFSENLEVIDLSHSNVSLLEFRELAKALSNVKVVEEINMTAMNIHDESGKHGITTMQDVTGLFRAVKDFKVVNIDNCDPVFSQHLIDALWRLREKGIGTSLNHIKANQVVRNSLVNLLVRDGIKVDCYSHDDDLVSSVSPVSTASPNRSQVLSDQGNTIGGTNNNVDTEFAEFISESHNESVFPADCEEIDDDRKPPINEVNEPRLFLHLPHIWSNKQRNGRFVPGNRGHGVKVAILDTGIDLVHPVLTRKVTAIKSFVPHEHACVDHIGHGTHCAGIIAGDRVDTMYIGVAPEVELIVGKVLNNDGKGTLKSLVEGITWAVENNAAVISLSLGFETSNRDVFLAIQGAITAGVIVICAASNNGRKSQYTIGYPGRYGNVLCVGSHTRNGQPSQFTSTGREVDFLAPGENIWSTTPGKKFGCMQGTSMAAPFVAGLAALVIAFHNSPQNATQNLPQCDIVVLRGVLRAMCSKSGHHDEASGYGVLDPWRIFKFGMKHYADIVTNV